MRTDWGGAGSGQRVAGRICGSPARCPLPATRCPSRFNVDLVRELVDVIGRARKVRREMFARAGDGFNDAVGEVGALKADRQLCGDRVPEAGGNFFVDALIAEDRELLFFAGDEEEDAVAQRGLRHAEALERALGDIADVAARLRLDVHADLARRLLLGRVDRRDDALLIERREKFFLRHHQPPEAPPPPKLPPPPEKPPPPPNPPPENPPPPPPNVMPLPPPGKKKSGKHPPQPLLRRDSIGRITKKTTKRIARTKIGLMSLRWPPPERCIAGTGSSPFVIFASTASIAAFNPP